MILTVFGKLLLQRIEKLLKPLSILAVTNIRILFVIINSFDGYFCKYFHFVKLHPFGDNISLFGVKLSPKGYITASANNG